MSKVVKYKVLKLKPIGVVHSAYTDPADIHPLRSRSTKGTIEIFPEFSKGLKDIEGFSHLYIIWAFHQSAGYKLLTSPLLAPKTRRGVFATRSPHRPNPIAITVAKLLGRKGRILEIKGLDMIDGTPVLDVKPYTPRDRKSKIRIGWLGEIEKNSKLTRRRKISGA